MTEVATPEPDPDANLPHEPSPGKPLPGWRQDWRNPAMDRWWTGKRWFGDPRPRPPVVPAWIADLPTGPGAPQVVVVQAPGYGPGAVQQGPQYLSGISTGEKIMHVVLSVLTLGLWLPIWGLRAVLSRRRIR